MIRKIAGIEGFIMTRKSFPVVIPLLTLLIILQAAATDNIIFTGSHPYVALQALMPSSESSLEM